MDALKPIDEICTPDPRWSYFVGYSGEPRQAFENYHAQISAIVLGEFAPEAVTQHFETAKNLFLYAWFVYRFLPVARTQVYVAVELALRWRFYGAAPPNDSKKMHGELMPLAMRRGWDKNEGFTGYWQHQRARAWENYEFEKLREMQDPGYKEINLDTCPEDFEGVVADPQFDYVSQVSESIRGLRNALAHGSIILHPGGLHVLRLCAEYIDQLFEPDSSCS